MNSDDEFDAEEDLANRPLNQQPLPIPNHDTIMRMRYVEGSAYEYMNVLQQIVALEIHRSKLFL